ncbi:hypothetical protein NESM_000918600 [Novymonas esmeraldas]|uniref:Uncharacterized protein n=1 Tax=Novymonas esmeraldas TaxID=1808958 RepID=A0AAW0EX16_9TRYP
MSSLLHYARCVAAVALLLGVATTAVQMANLTPSTATRLQLRGGDVVAGRRRADVGHVSLMSVALLCVLAAVVLHTVVGCKRVW